MNLLSSRGMNVGDHGAAVEQLRKVNYYRLSGYWYSFHVRSGGGRSDSFYPSTSLDEVTRLYRFDANLRAASFTALCAIELNVRALVGHAMGEVHECAHLTPEILNVRARGALRRETISSSVAAPVAPCLTRLATAAGCLSCTTQSWPFSSRRRTMLAPMRPKPIIAICTLRLPCELPARSAY